MISSTDVPTLSPCGERVFGTQWKNVEVSRMDSPGGMAEPLELIRTAASETRRQILRLLQQGFDHPEDLAKKLKIRRTSVDKQLVELFSWGLVDRAAVFPPNGRPRIVYQVTQRGRDLLDLLERVVKEYSAGFKADFVRELESLEARLAAGEIAEEMYFKRRKEIEARYALAL
jgi:predicted ArsR family transcriptional regulator